MPNQQGDDAAASGLTSIEPSLHPKQMSFPLPLTPHTTLHVQATRLSTSSLIFLTTTDPSHSPATSSLGSFIYAMPNRVRPSEVLSTALYAIPGSVDFATRVAKIVARRTGKPVYVGCSAAFPNATVEEEMDGLKVAIEGITEALGDEAAGEKDGAR
ncbi:hypothetical protein LPUS_08420 [Lasallia pustulata]|uniref:Proteasome assembly chaperone 4 n=1 Tax=Lasallia pustulata TaxID=136370 RepID=A0A1W5D565_9LECA|nr:hypothetical protein LPUS_08420 [Lasallia pustulata]